MCLKNYPSKCGIICEITGHRRKGKGLEVPCLYKFSGTKMLVNRMKKLTAKYEAIKIH